MCKVKTCSVCELPVTEADTQLYHGAPICNHCNDSIESYYASCQEQMDKYPRNGFEDFEDEIYNHGNY